MAKTSQRTDKALQELRDTVGKGFDATVAFAKNITNKSYTAKRFVGDGVDLVFTGGALTVDLYRTAYNLLVPSGPEAEEAEEEKREVIPQRRRRPS